MSTLRSRLRSGTAALAVLALALAGCASTEGGLESGTYTPQYSTDGRVSEFPIDGRGEPVVFSGTLETGGTATSTDWAGQVVVVNFWYAGCAPCRAEAVDLQEVYTAFKDDGVMFVGVNLRDQAGTALSYAETFGVTYPSILDANGGAVQLAFSGVVAPNAVPTTIVLDRQGRAAARIVGTLEERSVLETLIRDTLAESQ